MKERRLICAFCKRDVDPQAEGTYRRVTGWVKVRSGGGGNAIRLASPPDAFAHGHCVDRAARGGFVQVSLFPD